LDDENATVNRVLESMEKFPCIHLACHASQHAELSQSTSMMARSNYLRLWRRTFRTPTSHSYLRVKLARATQNLQMKLPILPQVCWGHNKWRTEGTINGSRAARNKTSSGESFWFSLFFSCMGAIHSHLNLIYMPAMHLAVQKIVNKMMLPNSKCGNHGSTVTNQTLIWLTGLRVRADSATVSRL
jgi:hypothetical protein